MVRQLFCSIYWHRITSSYRTIYLKPMIIFLKRPAFHSKHFRFSEHEKRKYQNNLKPHYKIAPKGAGLPYQICENKILVLFSYTILSLYWIDFNPILKKYDIYRSLYILLMPFGAMVSSPDQTQQAPFIFFLIIHYFERPASSVRLVKSIHLRACCKYLTSCEL